MTSSAPRADPPEIAVFAKAPVAGTVKTRLAPTLGAQGAAELHARLARQALATALEASLGEVALWCSPDERDPFFQACARELGARLRTQRGEDLGARMRCAFEDAFARGRDLLLIGGDCAVLDAAHLRAAATALRAHDAVFIPAEDGGYVLVGLARAVPGLFEGIAWGSEAVMPETRERLQAAGASWHELPALWDVDRPEDYARMLRGAATREAAC